jgi:hypothetical protein
MMRLIAFSIMVILHLGSWAQTNLPGEHCVKWMITSSGKINFHKPRTDCKSGFGLCIRLGQLEIRAIPCDDESTSNDLSDGGAIRFYAEWDGSRVLFRFPEQLIQPDNLKPEDFGTFSITEDELPIMNGRSDEVVFLRAGDYPVERKSGELLVSVDAGLAGKTR